MANNKYIGKRYVPKVVGLWDNTKATEYESLSVVYYGGNTYTSKQSVPSGIDITNTTYWALTSEYNAQYTLLKEDITHFKDDVNASIAKADNMVTEWETYTKVYVAESLPEIAKRKENTIYFKIVNSGGKLSLECQNHLGTVLQMKTDYNNVDCDGVTLKQYLNTSVKTQSLIDVKVLAKEMFNGCKVKLWGDSETAGVGGSGYSPNGDVIYGTYRVNADGHCYANEVKKYLEDNYGCTVVNYGISGLKSSQLVSNLDNLYSDDDDIIMCMIGTNDRKDSGGDVTLETNLQVIYEYVMAKGKKIIFLSGNPVLDFDDQNGKYFTMSKVNEIINKVCTKNGIDYIDIFSEVTDYIEARNNVLESYTVDGVHPNDIGHDVVAYLVLKKLGFNIKTSSPLNIYSMDTDAYYTTFYVNSSTGKDTNSGINTGSPFKTIARALECIPPRTTRTYTINIVGDYTQTAELVLKNVECLGNATINIVGTGDTKPKLNIANIGINNSRYIFNNLDITSKIVASSVRLLRFINCSLQCNETEYLITGSNSVIGLESCTMNPSVGRWAISCNWNSTVVLVTTTINGEYGVDLYSCTLFDISATYNTTITAKRLRGNGIDAKNLQDTGWTALSMIATTVSGSIKPQYRVLNNTLYFKGLITETFLASDQNMLLTVLPSTARPTNDSAFNFSDRPIKDVDVSGAVTTGGQLKLRVTQGSQTLDLSKIPPIPLG